MSTELHKRIDDGPLTALQVTVVVVCWLINMLDGFDILAISYTAHSITEEWALSPEVLGGVFSAGLLGMALGAMFIGPYCDRIGRRKIVLLCVAVIGVAMMATTWARTVTELMLLRLLTGLGIGGLFASLTALVAEYSPSRHRNLMIGFMHGGYPVGALLGGLLAAWLIPEMGWRAVFFAGGIVTALMAPVAIFFLPESPQFLLEKQPVGALDKLNRILRKLGQAPLESLPETSSDVSMASTSAVTPLFSPRLRAWTALLWLAFFCCMFHAVLFVELDAENCRRRRPTAKQGDLRWRYLEYRRRPRGCCCLAISQPVADCEPLIVSFLAIGTGCMILFPHVQSADVLLALAAVLGFFVLGGFIGLYSVAARLYPTSIRATGIGWGAGIGRFGAICGPYAGGLLIGFGWSMPSYFLLLFHAPFDRRGSGVAAACGRTGCDYASKRLTLRISGPQDLCVTCCCLEIL